MRDKKKMIFLGGAAFALIVAASVAVSLIHNNSVRAEGFDDGIGAGDELGIHYGGSFDEFADNPIEDSKDIEDSDGDDSETEIMDLPETAEEHYKKLKEVDYDELYSEEEKPIDRIKLYSNDDAVSEGSSVESTEGEKPEFDVDTGEPIIQMKVSNEYEDNQVICEAQSQEEAENIASQISGTLLSWNDGTATIQIEGSVDELLEQLEQQGSNLKLYRMYLF